MTEDEEQRSNRRNANRPIFDQVELLKELRATAKSTGDAISSAFAKGVLDGKRFDTVLRDIGKRFTEGLLKSALKPVEFGIGELINSGFRSAFSWLKPIETGQAAASTIGGLFNVPRFADGGVINEPTFFGAGRNLGLMGERGAEAILPLARGPDGRLGVNAGGAGRAASVTVNISTSDAESFRRSEGQISAAIARAVARGNRSL
jgi:phage-related minor tail protein